MRKFFLFFLMNLSTVAMWATGDKPVELTTFKNFKNLPNNTNFKFTGEAVVVYQWGDYVWLRSSDNIDSYPAVLHGKPSVNYSIGDIIPPNWEASKATVDGHTFITEGKGFEKSTTMVSESECKPLNYSKHLKQAVDSIKYSENDYVAFDALTLSNITSDGSFMLYENASDKFAEMSGFNKFNLEYPKDVDDKQFIVEGVISVEKEQPIFYPTKIEEIDKATPMWKVTSDGLDGEEYTLRDTVYVVKATHVEEPEGSRNYIYVTDNATSVYFDLMVPFGGEARWCDWNPDFFAIDCGNNEELYNKIAAMKVIKDHTLIGTLQDVWSNPRLMVTQAPEEMKDAKFPEISYRSFDLTQPHEKIDIVGHEILKFIAYYSKVDGKECFTNCDVTQNQPALQMAIDRRYVDDKLILQENKQYEVLTCFKIRYDADLQQHVYTACPIEEKQDLSGVNTVNTAREIVGVQYVNMAGITSEQPFEGMNMVVTTYADGTKEVTKKLQ